MKRSIYTLLLLGPLAACVQQEHFVKNGITYDRYERDTVGCATAATQAVPTNTQVAWAPYVGIYSQDTNQPLRVKNFELCMRDKGYQKVSLPYCAGDKLKAATERAKEATPRNWRMKITSASCYVHKSDGSAFLYTGE